MATFKLELDKNRVIVFPVGYAESVPLRECPSKRFKQTDGSFVVPFTRMNADILLKSSLVRQMPSELITVLKQYADAKIGSRQFPRWYKYKTKPLPDQLAAVTKLYRGHAGAFLMPMGVGKSKALIDTVTAHFYEKRIRAVVLLAPLTTTGVWGGEHGELAKHSPAPFKHVHADSLFDWTKHRPSSEQILWVTVGLESLSQGNTLKRVLPFIENNECAIAVDESHWIKNHKALRTQAALQLREKAGLRYILTGTLATRNMIDLYAQYDFLDPNIIGVGDWYAFRNRYCVMGGFKRREIVGYDNVDELMGLIEPYTYICDVPKDLPPQIWMPPRQVRMSADQFDYYQKVRKAELEGISVDNVLNKVLKLHQICGGHLWEDPKEVQDPITGRVKKAPGKLLWKMEPKKNPKLQDLLDVIEQEPDKQMVIWAKYLPEIEDILEAIKPFGRAARMTGEVSLADRQKLVADFQAGKYRFIVANQQVGGVSWTMTAGTVAHYYSNTNKLDDRLQSEKRLHRHGQKFPVVYQDYEMRTPKGGATVDSLVLGSIAAKKDLDQFIKDKIKEAGGRLGDVLI